MAFGSSDRNSVVASGFTEPIVCIVSWQLCSGCVEYLSFGCPASLDSVFGRTRCFSPLPSRHMPEKHTDWMQLPPSFISQNALFSFSHRFATITLEAGSRCHLPAFQSREGRWQRSDVTQLSPACLDCVELGSIEGC